MDWGYLMAAKRKYKKEYKKFQSSEEQKKKRAERNKNRDEAEKSGRVKKGDGKDVHHEGKKTTVMPASENRGKKEKSRVKGSKRKKSK